jgi:hypothetical protein
MTGIDRTALQTIFDSIYLQIEKLVEGQIKEVETGVRVSSCLGCTAEAKI